MPAKERFKTKYPGVYYIEGESIGSAKSERIFYIIYRKDGKLIEEKAGRQFQDDMTPARAANLRTQKINRDVPTNQERREAEIKAKIPTWTIGRLWEEYKSQKTLKGIVQDQNRYDLYLKAHFEAKEPHELVPLDIDRVRVKLLKTKSPQTCKLVLALLRRIILFGVKKRLSGSLPFIIEMPRVNNLQTEDLTPKQLKTLLDVISEDTHPQAGPMMKTALYTGMRRGELFRLKWTDVDFHRGQIHIRDPKGVEDQIIPLNDAAREFLQKHPREKSEFVFPGRNGEQRVEIKRGVNEIKRKAGLPKKFRPLHGLRHVYASMLASSGEVDLYTLQKLLTHKSPMMTQRYAHLRDESLKRASNLAGHMINQAMAEKAEDKVISLEVPKREPKQPKVSQGIS
jgi:integrase